jgi:hypothetical protein
MPAPERRILLPSVFPSPNLTFMASRKLTLPTIRRVALSFPGVEESTSYGTPAFKLKKKLLVRLHQDGTSLVLKVGDATRDHLLQADPDTFFVTDHYRGYPYVLAHLDKLGAGDLRKLIERAIAFR